MKEVIKATNLRAVHFAHLHLSRLERYYIIRLPLSAAALCVRGRLNNCASGLDFQLHPGSGLSRASLLEKYITFAASGLIKPTKQSVNKCVLKITIAIFSLHIARASHSCAGAFSEIVWRAFTFDDIKISRRGDEKARLFPCPVRSS